MNKKFLILLHPTNALWKKVRETKHADNHFKISEAIDELFGNQTHRNFQNWAKDPDIQPNAQLALFSQTIKRNLDINFEGNLFDHRTTAKEFGRLLGLSHYACNYIFDSAYTEYFNQIDSITYRRDAVEDITGRLCGIYKLYMTRDHVEEVSVAALDIRYFIANSRRRGRKIDYRIRCKLNVPDNENDSVHSHRSYFEYDGFLAYNTNVMTFLFESRPYMGRRTILQICLAEEPTLVMSRQIRRGELLTSGGNGIQNSGSYVVFLERIASRSVIHKPEDDLTDCIDELPVVAMYEIPRRTSRQELATEGINLPE